ncbi:thiol-disulfide oxidoreductase DCC family protein [Paenibacillus harenae]|uniref:thiol-disulfide oxidoreductase DCC family protein n=1 Tax=Paenibacillus harenae TaxID=306543 RepID=UPI0003FE7A4B|nr:DCC1-like thiol-disulfide oxidoreductase family protein [Paenibacillus harenae]
MKEIATDDRQSAILLIDGQCLLCSAITRFVVQRDRNKRFRFASLQSKAGKRYLLESQLPVDDFYTFVMIKDGRTYTKSNAALRVFRQLNGLWPLLYLLILTPAAIRDRVYDGIAVHRYRWFGKSDTCLLPTAEERDRFVKDGILAPEKEEAQDEK